MSSNKFVFRLQIFPNIKQNETMTMQSDGCLCRMQFGLLEIKQIDGKTSGIVCNVYCSCRPFDLAFLICKIMDKVTTSNEHQSTAQTHEI